MKTNLAFLGSVPRVIGILLLATVGAVQAALAAILAGPVSGGVRGWPFGSQTAGGVDLGTRGIIEAEYFLEGVATAYSKAGEWTRDGRWAATPNASAPYRTRLLVVRPAAPSGFNGTVVVEWLNVSSGWDNAEFFAHAREALLRGGFAWVGVSAQAAGVQGSPFALKAWDGARYGALVHPGDAYAFDILSDVVRALEKPQGADPLGRLKARRWIAAGHSQAANGLATYINAVHPLVGLYDGFLLHSRTAAPQPLHAGAGGAAPAGSTIRTDTAARVIAVQDEWTVAVAAAWLNRQADSPTFRLWEVAGTGHIDRDNLAQTAPLVQRDLGFPPPVCAWPVNEAPLRWIVDAALEGLDHWIRRGDPPPHARSFIGIAGGAVTRDSYGNATGGVRLPQLDVPTATHTGVGNAGAGPCAVAGISTPLDAATLAALYESHGAYVSRFVHQLNELRREGFVLPFDAAKARSQAGAPPSGHAERTGLVP